MGCLQSRPAGPAAEQDAAIPVAAAEQTLPPPRRGTASLSLDLDNAAGIMAHAPPGRRSGQLDSQTVLTLRSVRDLQMFDHNSHVDTENVIIARDSHSVAGTSRSRVLSGLRGVGQPSRTSFQLDLQPAHVNHAAAAAAGSGPSGMGYSRPSGPSDSAANMTSMAALASGAAAATSARIYSPGAGAATAAAHAAGNGRAGTDAEEHDRRSAGHGADDFDRQPESGYGFMADDLEQLQAQTSWPPFQMGNPLQVQVGDLLGRGGCGSVWSGTWRGRPVAIKVVQQVLRTYAYASHHPHHAAAPRGVAASDSFATTGACGSVGTGMATDGILAHDTDDTAGTAAAALEGASSSVRSPDPSTTEALQMAANSGTMAAGSSGMPAGSSTLAPPATISLGTSSTLLPGRVTQPSRLSARRMREQLAAAWATDDSMTGGSSNYGPGGYDGAGSRLPVVDELPSDRLTAVESRGSGRVTAAALAAGSCGLHGGPGSWAPTPPDLPADLQALLPQEQQSAAALLATLADQPPTKPPAVSELGAAFATAYTDDGAAKSPHLHHHGLGHQHSDRQGRRRGGHSQNQQQLLQPHPHAQPRRQRSAVNSASRMGSGPGGVGTTVGHVSMTPSDFGGGTSKYSHGPGLLAAAAAADALAATQQHFVILDDMDDDDISYGAGTPAGGGDTSYNRGLLDGPFDSSSALNAAAAAFAAKAAGFRQQAMAHGNGGAGGSRLAGGGSGGGDGSTGRLRRVGTLYGDMMRGPLKMLEEGSAEGRMSSSIDPGTGTNTGTGMGHGTGSWMAPWAAGFSRRSSSRTHGGLSLPPVPTMSPGAGALDMMTTLSPAGTEKLQAIVTAGAPGGAAGAPAASPASALTEVAAAQSARGSSISAGTTTDTSARLDVPKPAAPAAAPAATQESSKLQPPTQPAAQGTVAKLEPFGLVTKALGRRARGMAGSNYAPMQPEQLRHLCEVLECLAEVASGLAYLHAVGMVHGDIKSGNVLLKRDPRTARGFVLKLADFGFSRVLEHGSHTYLSRPSGTLAYLSPELLTSHRQSSAADVYAFGLLVWETVTTQPLFRGLATAQLLYAKTHHQDWLHLKWPDWTPFEALAAIEDMRQRFSQDLLALEQPQQQQQPGGPTAQTTA
eukprot:XP_001694544.1 predicted protein [Chlamydomonas reinhardtii]